MINRNTLANRAIATAFAFGTFCFSQLAIESNMRKDDSFDQKRIYLNEDAYREHQKRVAEFRLGIGLYLIGMLGIKGRNEYERTKSNQQQSPSRYGYS